MKQPHLGYADFKLDFACMHPAGCARMVSLCDYYDLCGAASNCLFFFSFLFLKSDYFSGFDFPPIGVGHQLQVLS